MLCWACLTLPQGASSATLGGEGQAEGGGQQERGSSSHGGLSAVYTCCMLSVDNCVCGPCWQAKIDKVPYGSLRWTRARVVKCVCFLIFRGLERLSEL